MSTDPISSRPKPDARYFETDSLRADLVRLDHWLEEPEAFFLVSGAAGTGKTRLIREAIARWGARVEAALLTNPVLTRTELIEEMVRRLGMTPSANPSKPELLASLERRRTEIGERGAIPVVVIDDAHELSSDLLGELRLLTNASPSAAPSLKIVLVAMPELESRLAEPAMASLWQRFAAPCRMQPLTAQDTRRYVHEVIGPQLGMDTQAFPRKTCGEFSRQSGGRVRTIEAIAMRAVALMRKAGARMVTIEMVQSAAATIVEVHADGPARAPIVPGPQPATIVPPTEIAGGAPELAADGERHESAIEEARREAVSPEKAPVAPHVKAPPGIPIAAPAAPTEPRATSDTPERTREWVERFIKPDEPRFGSLLIAASQSTPGTDPPVAAEDSVRVGARSAGSSGGGTRPRKRRSIWDRRHALRHGYHHRIPKWLTAGGMLAVAAVVVVVVGARTRHSWDASPDRNAEPKWTTAVSPTSLEPEPASQPVSSSASAPSKTTTSPTTPSQAVSSTPAPSAVAAVSPVRESATSEAAPAIAATSDAATPPLATPPASSRFAINVGSYLSEERARDERDRLVYETGLQGWVIPVSTDGYPSYQVVLGIYGTQERAEQSAEVLITRDLVSEAQVIPLPSRSQRVASP